MEEVEFIPCTEMILPPQLWVEAATRAIRRHPANAVRRGQMFCAHESGVEEIPLTVEQRALLVSKYWGSGGVNLTVSFPFDNPEAALQKRIVSHMNAWGSRANVQFNLTTGTGAQVRIARTSGQGYWSYLGTDVMSISANQPTMTLERFTMNTPESEFVRVVRHETGHTLGMPHEHMRKALVQRIDPQKAIAYFQRTQGWTAQQTRQQVLTPLNEEDLMGMAADQMSIMCYQLPGSITIDGQPIVGGSDIDETDYVICSNAYPKAVEPPPQPPPTGSPPTLDQAQKAVVLALAKLWAGTP